MHSEMKQNDAYRARGNVCQTISTAYRQQCQESDSLLRKQLKNNKAQYRRLDDYTLFFILSQKISFLYFNKLFLCLYYFTSNYHTDIIKVVNVDTKEILWDLLSHVC